MGVDVDFWKGKRVFLTGHTGFKGGWLSLWLQKMGAEVSGYALAPVSTPSMFHLARVGEGMRSIIGDVADAGQLGEAMRSVAPEIVIHMAAQPLVRLSYASPVGTYATNVMGTVHLLEAARHIPGIRAVVNVTSDKCYENRDWIWPYRENDPMGGHDPYSSSKGCSELVTASYRDSFFRSPDAAAVASARAGNVIGGGDWAADRLIPDILGALAAGRQVQIRNPRAVRPWQHVLEPLSGYLVLAQELHANGSAFAEPWNFGPDTGDARAVSWIVARLTALLGEGAAWALDEAPHPMEAGHLTIDCSKASQRLGWRPRWSLDTALEKIVEWHRAHLAGSDMRTMCWQQIAAYMNTERLTH